MFSCATPVDFVIYFMALVFSPSSMFHDYIETEKYCVIFIKNVFVQSQGKTAKKTLYLITQNCAESAYTTNEQFFFSFMDCVIN